MFFLQCYCPILLQYFAKGFFYFSEEVTKKYMKDLAENVKTYLQIKNDYVSRKQIAIALGFRYNTSIDRQIRSAIAQIAAETPILSPSHGKGYKLLSELKTEDDLKALERQWRENRKRAAEIVKRNEPIEKLLNKPFL